MTSPRGTVRFDPSRDWRVKYLQLSWSVRQLRRSYASADTTQAELESAARVTFGACLDLADWLRTAPAPVAEDEVGRVLLSEPMQVCAAMVRGLPWASAMFVPVQLGGLTRAWVEFRRDAVRSMRFDVLDLAERCLATWNWFLTAHDVALPSWVPGLSQSALTGTA